MSAYFLPSFFNSFQHIFWHAVFQKSLFEALGNSAHLLMRAINDKAVPFHPVFGDLIAVQRVELPLSVCRDSQAAW